MEDRYRLFDTTELSVYAIERVLEYGDEEAVAWMRSIFSRGQIVDVLRTDRNLTPLSANFWAILSKLPSEEVVALRSVRYRPVPDSQLKWHREVLPEGWAQAAEMLAARSLLEGFHLNGGTGLALHLGHRRSVDFDLFSAEDFHPTDLQRRLRGFDGLTIQQAAPGTLHLTLHGILVSFLHYPYPLLFPLAVRSARRGRSA